jgi:hypothetical protein
MRLSRRHVLAIAAVVPVALVAERGTRFAVDGVRSAASALRPPGQGTSATRCGLCGSPDHSMLDPRCPAAKRVA